MSSEKSRVLSAFGLIVRVGALNQCVVGDPKACHTVSWELEKYTIAPPCVNQTLAAITGKYRQFQNNPSLALPFQFEERKIRAARDNVYLKSRGANSLFSLSFLSSFFFLFFSFLFSLVTKGKYFSWSTSLPSRAERRDANGGRLALIQISRGAPVNGEALWKIGAENAIRDAFEFVDPRQSARTRGARRFKGGRRRRGETSLGKRNPRRDRRVSEFK